MTNASPMNDRGTGIGFRSRTLNLAVCCLAGFSLSFLSGCASMHRNMPSTMDAWDPGVEVRFPGATPADRGGNSENMASDVDVVAAADRPMPAIQRIVRDTAAVALYAGDQLGVTVVPRPLKGIEDYGDTKYTLIPGTYAFEYELGDFMPTYGAVNLYPVSARRARDFIRHTSIALTPDAAGSPSVLSHADLNRARNGDVVTKVVFHVDHRAVRDRLDDIDRSLTELARLRGSLDEQREYWARRFAERKLNSRYSSDFGWGLDVPGWDLALLQTLVGPERYHWHRMSAAEDKVKTYEQKLVDLDLPERRLTEEQNALRQLLHSVEVLNRDSELVIMTDSMVRPYHDPVDEVHYFRGSEVWAENYIGKLMFEGNDWIGPWGKIHFPYAESSLANAWLNPGARPLLVPTTGPTKGIGEVLMVVQVGARRPIELGGHSWVSNP